MRILPPGSGPGRAVYRVTSGIRASTATRSWPEKGSGMTRKRGLSRQIPTSQHAPDRQDGTPVAPASRPRQQRPEGSCEPRCRPAAAWTAARKWGAMPYSSSPPGGVEAVRPPRRPPARSTLRPPVLARGDQPRFRQHWRMSLPIKAMGAARLWPPRATAVPVSQHRHGGQVSSRQVASRITRYGVHPVGQQVKENAGGGPHEPPPGRCASERTPGGAALEGVGAGAPGLQRNTGHRPGQQALDFPGTGPKRWVGWGHRPRREVMW